MNQEFAVLDWIQQNLRSPFMDQMMVAITHLGDGGIIFMLLGLLLLSRRNTRNTGICLLTALFVEILLCNGLLKPLVGRVRPCYEVNNISFLIDLPSDYSFPSGHTAAACAATGSLFIKRSHWAPPAAILAALIAFSRLYLYVHYPTDILAGAFVGFISALCACKGIEMLLQSKSIKSF